MRTLILGVGNREAGDDAFGPAVLDLLSSEELPIDVKALAGDVMGIDLLAEIEDYDRLILVDAIRGTAEPSGSARAEASTEVGERGRETETGRRRHWEDRPDPVPGEVVVFRPGEVDLADPDPRFSLHDLSFGGCLRLARTLNLRVPEIFIVGFVLPRTPDLAPGMSVAGEAAVRRGAEAVRGLIESLQS